MSLHRLKYYESIKDVQTLALVSCALGHKFIPDRCQIDGVAYSRQASDQSNAQLGENSPAVSKGIIWAHIQKCLHLTALFANQRDVFFGIQFKISVPTIVLL